MFDARLGVPTPALVFLTVSVVAFLQWPLNFFAGSSLVFTIMASEIFVFAGVPFLISVFMRFDKRHMFPFKSLSCRVLILAVIAIISADIVMDYLTAASEYFFPLPQNIKQRYDELMFTAGTGDVIWKLFVLCALPAFCEEILVRGFCQRSLSHLWGNRKAIIAAAIIFAVLHGNPWYLHLYFILGLVFGFIFYATGSLWAVILCHFINNAWVLLNHVMGISLPLDLGSGLLNTLLVIVSVLIFFFSVRKLDPHPFPSNIYFT